MPRPGIFYSPVFLEHQGGPNHPENPLRLKESYKKLQTENLLPEFELRTPKDVDMKLVKECHSEEHVAFLQSIFEATDDKSLAELQEKLTKDTFVSSSTGECIRKSAGASAEAAELVLKGKLSSAFVLSRPPGHHAERNAAMGFCFVSNVALAAKAARNAGAQKVAIFDWDVHHGNGTEDVLKDDDRCLTISVHRLGGQFYPKTGSTIPADSPLAGRVLNIGLDKGSGDGDYMAVMHRAVLPSLQAFNPDIVLIAAGFDASEADPIGGMHVSAECFATMLYQIRSVCAGKVVLSLEGGYSPSATANAVSECCKVLLGQHPPRISAGSPTPGTLKAIQGAVRGLQARWPWIVAGSDEEIQIPEPELQQETEVEISKPKKKIPSRLAKRLAQK